MPIVFRLRESQSKIVVFPGFDLASSPARTTRGMHEQTETLLTDYILPAVGP
jgi:hypothetical protein